LATASLRGKAPSLELAKEILSDSMRRPDGRDITVGRIKHASARFFGIKESELSSSRRSRSVAFPRQLAMYLSRRLTSASFSEIGMVFGKRDHTTVIYAYRKIEKLLRTDSECRSLVEGLRKEIESGAKD
jgi:chromosomal replication initiator protein